MKRVIGFLFAVLVVLSLTQCHNRGDGRLVGVWQLQEMNVNGAVLKGNSLGNWLWEFNAVGGYLSDVAGMRAKGIYTLQDSLLTLKITTIKNRKEQVYKVEKLDSVDLYLQSTEIQNKSMLHFVKRKISDVAKEDKD